ncbi:MAG: hypothetical protein IPM63_05470 [Acidobacteriota bacterium]|nr:MAG: hypothetical protein IPM63_05470 [Acidobacteriota bacterium]
MMKKQIDRLYEVFSSYPRPTEFGGCECCTVRLDAEPLISKPLRALSTEDLEFYAFKAMTTIGNVDDFRYFLPRIVELTETDIYFIDAGVTFEKFHIGGFEDWPDPERRAIRSYLFAGWRKAVNSMDSAWGDNYLCGAGKLFDDISQFLDYADSVAPDFRKTYEESCSLGTMMVSERWRGNKNHKRVLAWFSGA